ncbi:conserved hypothetical protein [Rubrivivax sp. A210]|uniref:hypothetical protein n=1 Tax=Rubrivivax sp. A210 TaxID=2772301 RepID=UPI0019187B5E|nr:hypothetical protein [Rubrivivax sp. A210]CAD5371865.1 conserved hypothetical protein [Rubrivivax sp. A210]
MPHSKQLATVRKRIWRMSADAPFGEFIDAGEARHSRHALPDDLDRCWAMSTLELTRGLDVHEEDDDESAVLFATLFRPAAS